MARTRRVDTSTPASAGSDAGLGFSYHEEDGEPITDSATLERIRSLAIPPAWKDVWICPHPRGHIQATGYDDAGRKQYRYHDDWRESRDRIKFAEMEQFAKALPELRASVDADLRKRKLVYERVCSCAVRLLDLGLFRIGSERYETDNESYGLTTIKRSHVKVDGAGGDLRLPVKERPAEHPSDQGAGGAADAARAEEAPRRAEAEGLPRLRRRRRLARPRRGRRQRPHQGALGRRLQRQGLPHLERDRGGGDQRRRGRRGRDRRRRPESA